MTSPRETPLTATLTGHGDPEAELVIVTTTDDAVELSFDDGTVATFDRVELHKATELPAASLRSVA